MANPYEIIRQPGMNPILTNIGQDAAVNTVKSLQQQNVAGVIGGQPANNMTTAPVVGGVTGGSVLRNIGGADASQTVRDAQAMSPARLAGAKGLSPLKQAAAPEPMQPLFGGTDALIQPSDQYSYTVSNLVKRYLP